MKQKQNCIALKVEIMIWNNDINIRQHFIQKIFRQIKFRQDKNKKTRFKKQETREQDLDKKRNKKKFFI